MAVRGRRGADPAALQEQQAEQQRHQQQVAAGMGAQEQQLRELMQNPEVIERLAGVHWPDGAQSDKAWIPEIVEEHLHMDQVLSIVDSREMWEKQWLNGNIADEILMSYPCPEARTESQRQREVIARIRGDRKEPLDADERRKLRAALDRKTDRERRARGGKFMDLLLTQVVRSEESTSRDDDGGGLLSGLFGGGR